MTTSTFDIGNLFSVLGARGIERQLRRIVGVGRVSVNPVSGSTTVAYDPAKTSTSAIQAARLRLTQCRELATEPTTPAIIQMTAKYGLRSSRSEHSCSFGRRPLIRRIASMINFAKLPVRRAATGLSIVSLIAVAGCSAMASDSTMMNQNRPMAGMSPTPAASGGRMACMSMPQDTGGGMMGQDHVMPPGMSMTRTVFSDAEMSMHRKMMMASDVNTQRMWARKMIAHHRGAIEMSQVLLRSDVTDTEVRTMAQTVVDAQTREIAELESWLERHPG